MSLRRRPQPVTAPPAPTGALTLAAFSGSTDAGEAATGCLEALLAAWDSEECASLDAEEFYDFGRTRPHLLRSDGRAVISWPRLAVHRCATPDGRPVVVVTGPEPQFRWKAAVAQILDAVTEAGGGLLITLGAVLAEVAHTRPPTVFGSSEDPDVRDALRLEPSTYEGPTGLVGVLGTSAGPRGLPSASLWTTVPTYAPEGPAPAASLALMEQVRTLLGQDVPDGLLRTRATEWAQELDDLVAENPATSEYVLRLTAEHDARAGASSRADTLLAEVEAFLRDHT